LPCALGSGTRQRFVILLQKKIKIIKENKKNSQTLAWMIVRYVLHV